MKKLFKAVVDGAKAALRVPWYRRSIAACFIAGVKSQSRKDSQHGISNR